MTDGSFVTSASAPHVNARLSVRATGSGGEVELSLALTIERGWKLFGEGATLGLPITLKAAPVELSEVRIPAGELRGRAVVTAKASSWDEGSTASLGYQLCSHEVCERPGVLTLAFEA